MTAQHDDVMAQELCHRLAKPYATDWSGVAAALVTDAAIHHVGLGITDSDRLCPPDPDSVFEIGSITKVFTSILLAKFVLEGRVDADQPVADICPEYSSLPRAVTPRALATHTSGLPRLHMPTWRSLFMDATNPYAAFSRDDLIAWINQYRPRRTGNTKRPHYSNLGVGLLGDVLSVIGQGSYQAVIRREVLEPLGLDDTTVALDPNQTERLAPPHKGRGRPTPPWDFDVLAGAGALRSTINDLARFARHAASAKDRGDPVSRALVETFEVQVPGQHTGTPDQCLGWMRFTRNGQAIYHHDGGTLGSSSSFYVAPDSGVAMLVLANRGLNLRAMLRIERSRPLNVIGEAIECFGRSGGAAPAGVARSGNTG